MGDDIRSLIREVLAEELKAFNTGSRAVAPVAEDRVETVAIASDTDLNNFAKRVLELAGNEKARSDIKTGRVRFRLADATARVSQQTTARVETISFEKGLISEKKIVDLSEGSTIKAAKSVCFTPLALDEIRRKRIRVERMKK